MKIAVVIRGHSFRMGSNQQYGISTFSSQYAASKTHYDYLINPLRKLGNNVDIYARTYECPHSPVLSRLYQDANTLEIVKCIPGTTQGTHLLDAWNSIKNLESYTHVIILRFDIFLKQNIGSMVHYLIHNFQESIIFPFRMIQKWSKLNNYDYQRESQPAYIKTVSAHLLQKHKRCIDTFYIIPSKYFQFINKSIGLYGNHYMMLRLQLECGEHEHIDIKYLSDEESDSDPEKIPNSIYKFSSRNENHYYFKHV